MLFEYFIDTVLFITCWIWFCVKSYLKCVPVVLKFPMYFDGFDIWEATCFDDFDFMLKYKFKYYQLDI